MFSTLLYIFEDFLNICWDILNICFPPMRMVPTSDTSTWAPTVYSFAVPLTSSVSFLHYSISFNRAWYLPRLSFYFWGLYLLGLNFLIVCNTY